ncbi:tyrosine-type recombinase/integrase [Actinomadura algeriensis]|uniref:Site-specific recombinase XerD n=1 Tax=Actinomadura algeriensis TaxID=1679523 RepID=A0ABR9K0M7_9ACTN|nr:tyrosine-type recombinase/integrase [Actinomadura algeriensis]MBE1536382.1 site-specific recombinase XerD [Actinomadura algeriensis]
MDSDTAPPHAPPATTVPVAGQAGGPPDGPSATPKQERPEQERVLAPTALVRPAVRPARAPAGTHAPAPTAGARAPEGPGPSGATGRPPRPAEQAAAPAPLLVSVGDIPGLTPRRRRGDGGEVPGADVDLIDRLPRTGPDASWPTIAAWLRAGKTATTRRTRLADIAAFVRWLEPTAPGAGLWQVTEDVLVAYADELGTATGAAARLNRGGRPLAPATIARRLSHLASLYRYATRRHVITRNPTEHLQRPEVSRDGATPALTRAEAAALLDGAHTIAARHPADAAAVALLAGIGLRAAELQNLTADRVGTESGHTVIRFRVKGGKNIRVPLPPEVRVLLEPLLDGRGGTEPLLTREDGRPFDRWRQTTALRRAARAAGIAPARLTPHVLRATAATLLLDAGIPVERVQQLLGHASPVTTQRYDRGATKLAGHAAYQLSGLLATTPHSE